MCYPLTSPNPKVRGGEVRDYEVARDTSIPFPDTAPIP